MNGEQLKYDAENDGFDVIRYTSEVGIRVVNPNIEIDISKMLECFTQKEIDDLIRDLTKKERTPRKLKKKLKKQC